MIPGSSPRPDAANARQVIVRKLLPLPPERVFALFSEGPELAKWFCDSADTEALPLGELHCLWLDEDGEPWERVGRFLVFEPPSLLTIEWFDVLTKAEAGEGTSADPQVLADGQSVVLRVGEAEVPTEEPVAAGGQEDAGDRQRETLQVAIAAYPGGAMVTVISPLLHDSSMRPEIQHDAVRAGWEAAFEALAQFAEPGAAIEQADRE